MRKILHPMVVTMVALGGSLAWWAAAQETPATIPPPKSVAPHQEPVWKAGAARAIVTPEKNVWMAGYAARKQPAEGKVQELFAKALALEDETNGRLVIVTMDLIGVPQPVRREVAKRVSDQFQLPPERLVLNASHTHSGPLLRSSEVTGEDLKNPKIRDAWEYTQKLKDTLVDLVGKALADLQPARLTWNQARCGFAMNRRRDYSLPEGHPNAGKAPNPNGPVDHAVPTLRVEAPDGTLRAVMFGYACHNTSLGFYHYCGDYAGYAQQYLEEFRPECTAMFMTGCGGDQNPYPRRSGIVPGISDLQLAQQHGRSLANAVEVALTANPRPVTGPVLAAYEEIRLDYAKPGKDPHDYPVQVIHFGNDLILVTLGSEVTVDYSLRLKKELAGDAGVWVAGYTNDYTGYVPSLRVLKEGGYEAQAGWAEDVEERIVGKVHGLHAQLKAAK